MVLVTFDALRLPDSYSLLVGADTGTYTSALLAAVGEDDNVFFLSEHPNYRYVGGEIELTGISTPEWASEVVEAYRSLRQVEKVHGWVDPNSQFRQELIHYDLILHPNPRGLELRTEIARQYLQAGKLWLAPWLVVLPYELEQASWPEDTTVSGKFVREKYKDHTLDCFEHILSRRPRGRQLARERRPSFLDQMYQRYKIPGLRRGDPHLGSR